LRTWEEILTILARTEREKRQKTNIRVYS
jgi:hypothetical protein